MRRKLSILALVCALCLSTVFGVVFAYNTAVAEDAPTSITLSVKDTSNCSNGGAEDVTLGGIAMKKVTKGDNGRTTYKVNLEKTNVTSITGTTGTANDPKSWRGAIEVYVYLDMETCSTINFKVCEDMADEWSDIGARPAIYFSPSVEKKQLVKITAPICAGGYENDLTKLFVNVGGMYFDIYDSTGDVYVSDITFVETTLTALTYETIELPEPTVSVENVKSVTWTGETVNLKPSFTLLDGVTVESATYQVGEEQPVTVTADEDYNYTFNAVGDYTVAYTFVINGQTYNAEKTITVKQSVTEYTLNVS